MNHLDKYKYMDKAFVRRQAKHLSDNCSGMDLCIHKINKFLIFKFLNYEVVNSEKLTIDVFETEQEAIDFCLDRYSGSIPLVQLSMPIANFILSQKDVEPDIQNAVNDIYWNLLDNDDI